MKNTVTIFIIILFSSINFAQEKIVFEGQVLDQQTLFPLAYVNIGFIDQGIGSISNENGNFELMLDEKKITQRSVIQFSIVGYNTVTYTYQELKTVLESSKTIYLSPAIQELGEITLKTKWGKKREFGYKSKITSVFGYWKDKKALGGEIATLIPIRKQKVKLNDIRFFIEENFSDSIKIRLNIYKYRKKKPRANLLHTPVYFTITKKHGLETINIAQENIVVNSDFVVSIELIEVYGDSIGLAISGAKKRATSFFRNVSQDKWNPSFGQGVAFSVRGKPFIADSSLNVDTNRAIDTLQVFWDISYSQKDRLLQKELQLLKNYSKTVNAKTLLVTTFNQIIQESKIFNIAEDEDKLVLFLKSQDYLGASRLDLLNFQIEKADAYLLFSDGQPTLGDNLSNDTDAPVYCINSTEKSAHEILNTWSNWNEGTYINLDNLSVKKGVSKMTTSGDEVYINEPYSVKREYPIKGTVLFNNKPIQGCYVSLNNLYKEVITDAQGKFTINADIGDELNFEFLNMLPKKIKITDLTEKVIRLESEVESLDEVLVKGAITSKKRVLTVKEERELQRRKSGFANYALDKENFNKGATTIADLIRGRLPGVLIRRSGATDIFQSTRGCTYRFVVDGQLFDEVPNFVNIFQIENITASPSASAGTNLGFRGGCLIFITTTNSTDFTFTPESALAKNNSYKENNPFFKFDKSINVLDHQLQTVSDPETVDHIFKTTIENNPYDINNYIVSYKRLYNQDPNKALSHLLTALEIAPNNNRILRSLAFQLEASGDYEYAQAIFSKILKHTPHEVQSYIDLAQSNIAIENYSAAFELYKFLLSDNSAHFSMSQNTQAIVETEMKHLLTKYKDKIAYEQVPLSLYEEAHILDRRFTLEWTNSQLEFEIQFVSPENKFINWSHTVIANRDEILDELENGTYIKEFSIEDPRVEGQWIVNITNKTEKPFKIPAFIKLTTYTNYGNHNEDIDVKIIPVSQLDRKYTVHTTTVVQ